MIAERATLRDLQEWHDINDLADFHEALDIEVELMPKPKPRRK